MVSACFKRYSSWKLHPQGSRIKAKQSCHCCSSGFQGCGCWISGLGSAKLNKAGALHHQKRLLVGKQILGHEDTTTPILRPVQLKSHHASLVIALGSPSKCSSTTPPQKSPDTVRPDQGPSSDCSMLLATFAVLQLWWCRAARAGAGRRHSCFGGQCVFRLKAPKPTHGFYRH